jgi:hypothetical protein
MPTLQELEKAFLAADAQGNTEDAQVFATEIKKLRAEEQQPLTPLGMGAARQKAELEAAANDPSMAGSFLRGARENLGAGVGGALAGAASGAATGAGLGAMGLNPITVGIGTIGGSIIGGIGGAFGGQKIQEAIDPITEERQAAIARDMEVNPISSFSGQIAPALITGKFSPGNIRTALTPLGRASNAVERAAIINSRINVGSEVGIGGALDVGQALASGQPMDARQIALNAAAGAFFSDPNRLGRALGQGAMIPAPIEAAAPAPVAAPSPIPQRGPLTPTAPTAPPVATGRTRLAGDMAARFGIDPMALVPSGAGATVTPNDVRAAAANIPAITSDSGGTIDITPARKPDPTITDLIDSDIEWEGQAGKLVDDEGRPALLRPDGALVELPFNYGTDRSLADLGVQPTFDRQQDRATATRFFGETENESLQSVFSTIDNNTDDLLDIAELGVSLKKQKGQKSIPVHDTPEFAPQLRSITDEQILLAEDQIKQAIDRAQNNPSLSDETRTAVINKLSGDLENIAAITAARDAGKYQRLPLPVGSPEVPSQRASIAAADAIANARAASRILNNEPALPAEASAAPVSRKLTLGPEETGIAPVALENAGTLPPKTEEPESFFSNENTVIVVDKTTGKAVAEIPKEQAPKLNTEKYEAVAPNKYLGDLNTKIAAETNQPAAPEAPAPRQLSATTRAKKLAVEIKDIGNQIMAQRQKITDLKKNSASKQTITKAEKQLAKLQDTQSQKKQERADVKFEIPRVYKGLSKAASKIRSAVWDNIENFPGLNSIGNDRIKSPPPLLALILGKQRKKITLSSKEINFLAENRKGGEYDGFIKISDIDAMPGTPEGREAAKDILRSIYAKHDDYSASGPDTISPDKDAGTLWSELRSEIEDIAQGKSRAYEDEYDAYMAKLEAEAIAKEEALAKESAPNRPVSQMDIRNQDSRQLFDDDGGFALASENTQDGAEIVAERNAKEEAAKAQDKAQGKLFEETSDTEVDDFDPMDNNPFSKTDAPARTADTVGVEKAADDFFGGKRPDNVKVVNEPKANWEARIKGNTIELNAAKLGPEGVRSALNEEVGHVVFRDEKERANFYKLYGSLDETTRAKIDDTVERLYSDASPSIKAEERLVKALRSILDRTPEGRTFWQKLLQIARRAYKTLTGQAAKDPEMIAAAMLRRGIKNGKATGPDRMSATPPQSYRKALDAAKQEVADRADYKAQAKTVLAEIKKLPKAEQKPATVRMYAELDEARIIGKGKDRQFKVEMPKVVQELIAAGKPTSEADVINALTAKFPEQKNYLKKNFERLVTDMLFAEEVAMAGENTPWGNYVDSLKEHFTEISEGVKTGSTLRHIQRGLSLFRNTYFNGIGGKMQALADGKLTGKNSTAANKFFADIIGVRASQDGVNFEGVDGLSERDVRQMTNERIKFDTDLEAYFKKEGMGDAARAAWLERVSDHVVNPSRDAELAQEPKLKEAVDYFIKRRRERLAYLREAGVDVGDAGERSLSRSINTEKVLSNPKEFVEKAKRAYMRKWAREISDLREQQALKEAEGKNTASIKDKIRDLEKMDAQVAAEKYLYAITSDDTGISSDGNDITAAEGGGQPSFLKKREFGPEADELLGKFYHRNIAAMDTAEALATVRAATKARVLADKSYGNKIDPVGKWKKLRAELEAEGNQDMIPIAAQLVKDYLNLNGSNNDTVRKLVGHLHTYTQLAYLSHATVASLGEPAMIGARTGSIIDTGRAYAQIAKGIVRALRKAGPDEIRILNRELGLVADSFDGLMSSQALGDSFGGRGKGGGLVTNFHRLTGLSGWTNLTFDAATKIGKSFIASQVKLAKAGGSMSTLAKRELNELGMSTKDIDVVNDFITKLDKASDQNKLILGDEPGADLYRKALAMFHKTGAALNPTRGTRGQKANNPVAGLFYQLQSFLYDFHQKFTLRQARRLKDAYRGTVEIDGAIEKLSARERSQVAIDAAKAIAAIYGLQYGIQVLRETLFVDLERNKRDKEKTQGEINMARALGAASRTGILGPYDTLFNIISGARYQREPATVVLGPAVGGMSELFQSVVKLYGDRNSGNTNTTERKLVRTAYNTLATPAMNAVFAGMPAGPLSAGLVQAFRHPLTREAVVSGVAGPIQTKKKGPMKTTKYY